MGALRQGNCFPCSHVVCVTEVTYIYYKKVCLYKIGNCVAHSFHRRVKGLRLGTAARVSLDLDVGSIHVVHIGMHLCEIVYVVCISVS